MKARKYQYRTPLIVGIGFLLLIILIEFSAIMTINDGFLVYTLDDPYIHMALSENIMQGHYGVNINEFSAPSSSILWPFLIAPLASFEYFPLLFNMLVAMATIIVIVKIAFASFGSSEKRINDISISAATVFLILITNMVGLIFTGMEHSLQVFFVAVIVYGLIVEIEKNRIESWFLIAIVAAPLIRYENLAISIAALVYLVMRRYFKQSVSVMALLLVFVGGFSFFLTTLGLDIFPASVAVKSSLAQSDGVINAILANLNSALLHRQAMVLMVGVLVLFSYSLFAQDIKKKQLALVSIFAVFMHYAVGKYDHYNRYEIYIWSFLLLIFMYFLGPQIKGVLVNRSAKAFGVVAAAVGFAAIAGSSYISDLFTLPIASNNIFQQQYQMHRFAVDFYDLPVAVNDLGYVSYNNDNYVLDLWGMASATALDYRHNRNDGDWMRELADENNVGLGMIYEEWFEHIPDEWIKIGDLHLGRRIVTPAYGEVAFYATSQNSYSNVVEKLHLFVETLPPDVEFTFQ